MLSQMRVFLLSGFIAVSGLSQAERQDQVSIVFGSFSSPETAAVHRDYLQRSHDQPLVISEFSIRGTRYYRILDGPWSDINEQRRRLAAIRESIEPGAWLLIEQSTSPRQGAWSGVEEQFEPKVQRIARSGPTSSDEEGDQLPILASEKPGSVLAIAKPPTSEIIRLNRRGSKGVDATQEPIVLKQFADNDIDISIDGKLMKPSGPRCPDTTT